MRDGLFWFATIAFGLHQIAQYQLGLSMLWADSYLDPFCMGILVLYAYQYTMNWWAPKKILSLLDALLVLAFIAAISELLIPYFFPLDFKQDIIDVLAIFAGGGLFLAIKKTNI